MADDRDHNQYEYDVFISHASEDKESFVRQLASKLRDNGIKVWYDEFSLEVGDSLTRSIDKGLAHSRFGIVVLSNAFLRKAWPEYELRGLLARQVGGEKVILPIWHEVDRTDLIRFSPSLADLIALNTQDGLDKVTLSIIRVIRPDLFRALLMRAELRFYTQNADEVIRRGGKVTVRPISSYKPGPRRRQKLTDGQMRRIRIIFAMLGGFDTSSFEHTYDMFLRDLTVEDEIQYWEWLALIHHLYRQRTNCSMDEAKELYRFLLLKNPAKFAELVDESSKARLEKETGLNISLIIDIIRETSQHPELSDEE